MWQPVTTQADLSAERRGALREESPGRVRSESWNVYIRAKQICSQARAEAEQQRVGDHNQAVSARVSSGVTITAPLQSIRLEYLHQDPCKKQVLLVASTANGTGVDMLTCTLVVAATRLQTRTYAMVISQK